MARQALLRRISFYADLDEADQQVIMQIKGREQSYEKNTEIIDAGQEMDSVLIVKEGWAIRYKTLEDGRRQILNVLLAGDMFDLQVLVAAEADHSVKTVTNLTGLSVRPSEFRRLLTESGKLTLAFWWMQVQEEAFLREQIVRNGKQTARERIVHFLLELYRRVLMTGAGNGDGFRVPLTQTVIADALGLTPIHTNRVLRQLERDGLLERANGWILFKDQERLAEISQFDTSYFHLDAFRMRLGRE
ncbi:MAG: Crp/Fnr family transcriptional regulator [Sphingomonadales bacterium]|nr:Crp/Fnr family transcriptional regulator [Sphingomonadales bacterium]PIX66093.1 MAG: Crp/Fnr family transcriptional regulator [Sphingomonadales bacterium CG_4_10_14_3_um_filter_58_15]NCO49356.1 Crp/Fnr family transcriptional regulator [Sphingomonadales bacterium]NCO99528.1 Crp/Fnr family transcriptional regulator [Sphingomonadales bacterium]NCP27762.1 Crp/Fnr family transcriptional regulator [Sphingomonadales bacterium]